MQTDRPFKSFSRFYDAEGRLEKVLCPLCFEVNDIVSARAGGCLSTDTESGKMSDVCVECAAKEWLYFAAVMGA